MAEATITLPTPLRPYADNQSELSLKGETVGALLSALIGEHSGLQKHLYDDAGKLRSFVNVYLNDDDIRYLSKEDTPVKDGDVVSIIPSIAGG